MTSNHQLMTKKYIQTVLAVCVVATIWSDPVEVSSGEPASTAQRPGEPPANRSEPRKERWRFGVSVKARGAMNGIMATLPVPKEWPEQAVKVLDQQKSRQVRSVRFRELGESVNQMRVAVPRLAAGGEATATVTMEIVKRDVDTLPPDPQQLRVPSRVVGEMRQYLRPSPYIDSEDRVIMRAASQVVSDKETGWSQAEAIYDWVRENVEYRFAREIKSARQALDDGYGDCEEMTSLFIAMCRAVNIPARAVWVPGHCYPEFYLEDPRGNGCWYPCQAAGARSFGTIEETRPILQKGDNIRVPNSRQPRRYARETLAAEHSTAPPDVKFIRKALDNPAFGQP
ncbi:MAG: transglutaminase-like domain-containing protein [Planctomycetota bacterium]